GVLPLILSRGAGAEMRQTLGTAVFSGMLGVTMFGIVLTPVFFYTIDWLGEARVFHLRGVEIASRFFLDLFTLRVPRLARLTTRRLPPAAVRIAHRVDPAHEGNGSPPNVLSARLQQNVEPE